MIPKYKMGNSDLMASQMGLGCMGMSEVYGPIDEKESLKVFDECLAAGSLFSSECSYCWY